MTDVPTPDGAADTMVVRPDDHRRYPGVLLFMDAFGLRDRLEEMAGRIADHGYHVVVPNLFYRQGRAPLVENLTALLKSEDRTELMSRLRPFMQSLTPEAAMRDAGAYLDFLAAEDLVSPGPVGVTGYCMGGRLALRTAAAFPDRVAAVASFHGGNLANDAPDSPHLQADRIRAEVYVGHADNDRSMPPEQIQRLETALSDAGLRFTTELYADAAHGFTMSDTAAYDEAATARHWDRLLDLFDRNLSGRVTR